MTPEASRESRPARGARLVGREADLIDLAELLGDEPLVSVVGVPGVGKSTLVRELVRRSHRQQAELRTELAEVSGVRDVAGLLDAIRETLFLADATEQAVRLSLRSPDAPVLVLDHCDAFTNDTVAWVEQLSARCPGATIVCVSRATLFRHALRFEVTSLLCDVPSDGGLSDAALCLREMLARRGREQGTTDEQLQLIAERLEGLPVALEWSATMLSVLTAEELFETLSWPASAGDVIPEPVRESFVQSQWNGLGELEKDVVAALCVAQRRLSRDDLGELNPDFSKAQVLADLEARSLLRRDGERLMTVAWVAWLVRSADPERFEKCARMYAGHLFRLGAQHSVTVNAVRGAAARAWFAEHERELRHWLRQPPTALLDATEMVEAAIGCSRYLKLVARPDERIALSLAARTTVPSLRARLLLEGIDSSRMRVPKVFLELMEDIRDDSFVSSFDEAAVLRGYESWFRTGLPVFDASHQNEPALRFFFHYGQTAHGFFSGQLGQAIDHARSAIVIARREGELLNELRTFHSLGTLLFENNNLAELEEVCLELRELAERVGATSYLGEADMLLGRLRWMQGHYDTARKLLFRARDTHAVRGHAMSAYVELSLGDIAICQGHWQEAATHYDLAETIAEDFSHTFVRTLIELRRAALDFIGGREAPARTRFELAQKELRHDRLLEKIALQAWQIFFDESDENLARVREQAALDASPRWNECVVAVSTYRAHQRAQQVDVAAEAFAVVQVNQDCSQVVIPGVGVQRLRRNTPIHRIVSALVDLRMTQPGKTFSASELQEIGWPGQTLVGDSGSNRLWVSLSRLRSRGFEGVMERVDEGYRLSLQTVIERENAAAKLSPARSGA